MLLPRDKADFPKAIYLDQNMWSNLAKGYYAGLVDDVCKSALTAILSSIKNQRAIYPVGFTHFIETHKMEPLESRINLAKFVLSVSTGISILNSMVIRNLEIRGAVRNKIVAHEIMKSDEVSTPGDLRVCLLVPGVVHVLGLWELEGVPEKLEPEYYRELIKPQTSEMVLTAPFKEDSGSLDAYIQEEAAREIEKRGKRALADGISNKDWINYEFLEFFRIDSHLRSIKDELDVQSIPSDTFFYLFKTRKDCMAFFEDVYSYFATVRLYIEHHRNVGGSINTHDLNDVQFVSEVIPYFNGIVLEKHWAAMAKQTRLDRRWNTKIISEIKEIPSLLKDLGCI